MHFVHTNLSQVGLEFGSLDLQAIVLPTEQTLLVLSHCSFGAIIVKTHLQYLDQTGLVFSPFHIVKNYARLI